jgi:hypothetical protein
MLKISLPVFGQVEVQANDGERGAIVRLPDAKVENLPVLFAVEPPFFIFHPSIQLSGFSL